MNIQDRREIARAATPWRDAAKDWLKIRAFWIVIIVLTVLLVKSGAR